MSPCFSFRVVSLTPGRTLGKIVSQTILWIARWPQGPVLMKTVSWSYSPAGVRQPLCSRCLNQFDFFSLDLKRKGLLQLSSDLKSKMQWRCQRTTVMHLSLTQVRSTQLLQLFGGPDLARPSAFWSAQFCIFFCRRIYLHWWRTLMPSGCNMCDSRDSLA